MQGPPFFLDQLQGPLACGILTRRAICLRKFKIMYKINNYFLKLGKKSEKKIKIRIKYKINLKKIRKTKFLENRKKSTIIKKVTDINQLG